MAQLVFLKRTIKEIEIFGGDVFFDIDGKNAGKLSLTNQTIDLPIGAHTVKMYKTNTFDTFIGIAETTITLKEDERLMVKYSAPMMVNQPGNMVISEYSELKVAEAFKESESAICRDFVVAETLKNEDAEDYNIGVVIVFGIAIVLGIIWCLW